MEQIEIKFTVKERDLVLEHTIAGPDLINRLKITAIKGKKRYIQYDCKTD